MTRVLAGLALVAAAASCAHQEVALCADCRIELVQEAATAADGRLLHRSMAVQDSDGSVYVAPVSDAGTVAVYGPDGQFLRSIGRRGGGPGELDEVSHLSIWPGDTLAVISVSRVSVFSRDGRFARSFAAPGYISDLAVDDVGRIFVAMRPGPAIERRAGPVAAISRDGKVLGTYDRRDPASRGARAQSRNIAGLADGFASIGVDRLDLRLFSADGREIGRFARDVPWLKMTKNAAGFSRPGGGVIDLAIGGDTAWILMVRRRFPEGEGDGAGSGRPAGPARERGAPSQPRAPTVVGRAASFEPVLEVVDLRRMGTVATVRLPGRVVMDLLGPGRLATLEEDERYELSLTIWRARVVAGAELPSGR